MEMGPKVGCPVDSCEGSGREKREEGSGGARPRNSNLLL